MNLSIALQHHPDRADLLHRTAHLHPEVVTDPDWKSRRRNPWRCYRECLRLTPEDATHRLVLQDDGEPCGEFRSVLERAIAAKPDDLICLFISQAHRRGMTELLAACDAGRSWCRIEARAPTEWIPVVALVWPTRLIPGFLEWAASAGYSGERVRADDAIVGEYVLKHRLPVWATVPCLVEHPDDQPSTVGNGHKIPRRAVCFAGDRAATIDWSLD